MNLSNLTSEEKTRVKKIFLYGVSVGKNNSETTDTQALRKLEDVLKTQFTDVCEDCGRDLVETRTSQDIDGNRGEFMLVCPICDK